MNFVNNQGTHKHTHTHILALLIITVKLNHHSIISIIIHLPIFYHECMMHAWHFINNLLNFEKFLFLFFCTSAGVYLNELDDNLSNHSNNNNNITNVLINALIANRSNNDTTTIINETDFSNFGL